MCANRRTISCLRQNRLDHTRFFHACRYLVQTLEFVCEPFVIDPEQMQQGRLEVTIVNRITNNIIRELVRFAVDDSALYARSRNKSNSIVPAVTPVTETMADRNS